MRQQNRRPEDSRSRRESARDRDRDRDRGYRGPQERPYARDSERRTEFRGPEFDERHGYASRFPSRAERDDPERDEELEAFGGFGEERPQDHPGYERAERFGSESAGYGRQRMREPEQTGEQRADREHERYGGFGGGGYLERRTSEHRPWQPGESDRIGFPQQGRGTAHPGSSRWAQGAGWDQETERIGREYSRERIGGGGRPSERIDEWARGTAGRPSGTYAGRGPKTYRRSDERLREDVCERLTRDGDVDATDIEVEVSGGEVTLKGIVETRDMKRRAEDATLECDGISEVHNQLRVGSPG